LVHAGANAQKPNIRYDSPQTLFLGKQITPINAMNTGGVIPARLAPQVVQVFSASQSLVRHFVKSPSGELFGIQDASIIKIRPDGSSAVLAGTNTYGYVDGQGTSAQFNQMTDIIRDNAGNFYVTESNSRDATNGRIRKITPAGVVTTYAQGLSSPTVLAMDANGLIYVAEQTGRIMKVAANGTVSFLAGQPGVFGKINGAGAAASFYGIVALLVASDGNLYALESTNNLIRKITPGGLVTTFAGTNFGNIDGNGTAASFFSPKAMQMDSKGNLIVADGNSLFRSVNPSADVVTVLGPTYYDGNGQVRSPAYYDYFIINEDDNVEYFANGLYQIQTQGFAVTPALPAGLSLNNNGTITGTPSTVSPAKNYKISAGNALGTGTFELNLTVSLPADPPVITSFSPTSAYAGQQIIITGTNFTGATAVSIGGKPVSYIFIASPTSIAVTVPAGTSAAGEVTVTNPYGTASLGGFTLIPPPAITSVSPLSAPSGGIVTITGTNLSGVGQVSFGGYNATFTLISATQINAVVGSGASGPVNVWGLSGSANFPGFTYIPGPTVSAVSPNRGGPGDEITITGTNFTDASDVGFGNISASSFTVISPTTIKATISAGSGNGVSVTTPGGKSTNTNFTFIPPPTISQVNPMKGGLNSPITILGSNLANSQVTIGGVPAIIGYTSANQIVAYVGSGASSGELKVTNSYGTASIPGFIWVPAPTIGSFTPATATSGDIITISGTALSEVTTVSIGGVNALFTVISPTSIQATVASGASGPVSVSSPGGTASMNGFIYSGPFIKSFSPFSAGSGQTVVLIGENFTNTSQVYFGGVPAISFTVNSPTQITAVVGSGKSGNVSVTTPFGQANAAGFNHPAPSISYFSPTYSGPLTNAPISINGNNFTNASAVSFGGIPATSFTVQSSTLITAVAPASSSGNVVVVTPLGQDSRPGFVWAQPPTITTFSPTAQKSGGQITITGTNFFGVTAVKIAGISVPYSTTSPTSILVYINNEVVSGNISVSTAGGNASIDGFIFSSPVIQRFSPLIAASGQTVTISGNNFNDIQSVKFGGINASSFAVVSPTTITATVANGNSGLVTVASADGTANIAGFTFLPPPLIYSFSPSAGGLGTSVSINGSNLLTTSSVTIGGVSATINSVSNSMVVVSVSSGASGKISLTTDAGTAVLDGFSWYSQPQITAVSPLSANGLTEVTITGTNFTGITAVKFGSSPATFTVLSPTQIKVMPINSSSGIITVTNPGGTASFQGFSFLPAPNITSFTKTGDGSTAEVIINGSNFTNVTSVKFGRSEASSFTVNGPSSIKAIPGAGETGPITVTGDGGSGSIDGFSYHEPPAILSFSQPSGPIGTTISIIGANFNTTPEKNVVYFGPVKARVINAAKTRLEVVVPAGAGNQVTATDIDNRLTGYANLPFQVTAPASFSGFSNKFELNFNSSVSSLDIKDFDEDGNPDFLIAKNDSLYILLHGNDKVLSRSSFGKKVNLLSGKQVTSTVVGDVDGDGKPDVLVGTGLSIILLRNTSSAGNISFSQVAFESLDNSTSGMLLRDLDMDGRPDLIVGHEGLFYQNTSNGTQVSFGTAGYFKDQGSSEGLISFTLADIDGDNKPEPIFGSSYGGHTIFKNNSLPGSLNTLQFPAISRNQSIFYSYILLAGDFDGDGKVDLLENNFSVISNVFLVSKNISVRGSITTSSLQPAKEFLNSGVVSRNRLADIDGDGKIDLVGMTGSAISYARNQSSLGNINFATSLQLIPEGNNNINSFLVDDVDGDGRNDIMALDYVKNKITIYHNGPVPTPQINSIFPLSAAKDSTVTISGKYFDQASSVFFGTIPAKSFQVISAQRITAIVGEGESGSVTVKNPDGENSFTGFTFLKLPVITSALASTDGSGRLKINGSNFNQTTKVAIGDVKAESFQVISDTEIEATFLSVSGIPSVTNTSGTSSFAERITLLRTPLISASGPLSFYPGDSVLLKADSQPGYAYQWLRDGITIAGATSGSYSASEGGTYTVTVTLEGLSKTSAATIVKLFTVVPIPTITASGPIVFYPGESVSLTASSQAGYTYQWLKDGIDIPGATSVTYTTSQGGTYTVTVMLEGVSKTSASTVVKLLTFVPIPTITASGPINFYPGEDVTLTTGSQPGYTYQWLKDGVNMTGAISASYSASQSGAYTVTVTLDGVSKTSAATVVKLLTVIPVPTITASGPLAFFPGDNVSLATSLQPGYSYQWLKDGVNITGATSNIYTATQGGTYTVTVTLDGVSKTSVATVVKGLTNIPVPTITASGPLAFFPGDSVSLATSLQPGYSYQWLKDGVNITAATSNIYTATQGGTYTVTVTLDGVSKTSAATVVKLLTNIPVPTITASGPLAFFPGDSVSLATSLQPGYSYQWLKDGINITGATSNIYTATQGGTYTVTITLDGVSKTSGPTVTKLLPVVPIPTITASGPLELYPGGSVLLTANSELGYTYQWFRNGVNIVGATSLSYTASQSGAFTVTVTLDGVSKTSAVTVVTSAFALPASNFIVTVNGATCHGFANGTIGITAAKALNYTATITGGNLNARYPFTNSTSIDSLSAGTYNVCLTVAGESGYVQCFTVVITEPKSLAVYAAVNNSVKSVNLTLEGGSTYHVTLNGITTTTSAGNITLSLKNGTNDLTVATDKSCQGIYQKRFDISTGLLAYPNPFTSTFDVNLGNTTIPLATIELFKMSGEKVYSKQFTNASGNVPIEPINLPSGIYLLSVKTGQMQKTSKVIKL